MNHHNNNLIMRLILKGVELASQTLLCQNVSDQLSALT